MAAAVKQKAVIPLQRIGQKLDFRNFVSQKKAIYGQATGFKATTTAARIACRTVHLLEGCVTTNKHASTRSHPKFPRSSANKTGEEAITKSEMTSDRVRQKLARPTAETEMTNKHIKEVRPSSRNGIRCTAYSKGVCDAGGS